MTFPTAQELATLLPNGTEAQGQIMLDILQAKYERRDYQGNPHHYAPGVLCSLWPVLDGESNNCIIDEAGAAVAMYIDSGDEFRPTLLWDIGQDIIVVAVPGEWRTKVLT